MNNWQPVKGKLFTPRDLANFTEERYITFLQFCVQFMVPSEEGPKYSNTKDLWLKSEEIMLMPDHPFEEYLWRINFFSTNKDASYRKFFAKLLVMMNTTLKYIQRNPSVVTDEMRKIIEMYPRFEWALKQTAIVPTQMGTEVMVQKSGVASFDEQLYNAGVKTVNMLERLVDSISDRDIKNMKSRDKMIAIGRLGYVFQIAKSLKPNRQIFQQINIHGADRDTLEKALLGMNKEE